MAEQRTIILPRNMPIDKRISAAKAEVTKWLDSLDEPAQGGQRRCLSFGTSCKRLS